MLNQFFKFEVVKFTDKSVLYYCLMRYLSLRLILRMILGKSQRDVWFKNHNISWMKPITGKKILIKNEQGFKFWIRANTEDIDNVNLNTESKVLEFFKPTLNDIVIDVGANLGKYSIYCANLVGVKGIILALEPFLDNFDLLNQNIVENNFERIIQPLCIAASNKKDKVRMYFKKNYYGQNSIVSKISEHFINVKTDTIDSILSENKIEKVNWIKIDVEGAEFDVLLGAIKTLTNNNINLILEVREKHKNEIFDFLKSLHYSISIIETINLESKIYDTYYNVFAKKTEFD